MKPRILLLISRIAERQVFETWLSDRLEIVLDIPPVDRPLDVDACILDGLAFERHGSRIHEIRVRSEPLAFPVILIDGSSPEKWASLESHPDIDVCLHAPVASQTLLATLERLLQKQGDSRQVEARRQFLQAILDQSMVGIYLLVNGCFVYANPLACRLFGRSAQDLLRRDGLEPFAQADRERVTGYRKGISREGSYHMQAQIEQPDGTTIPVEIQEIAIEHQAHHALCGTILDVGARLRAEEARLASARREQSALSDLEHAREESRILTRVFNAVSHELRTPLAEIKGYTELMQECSPICETGSQGNYLASISHGVRRLELLVQNLLQYTRFESQLVCLDKQLLDLAELIQLTCSRARCNHPAHTLELQIDERVNPALVEADGELLELVLRNLLENAFKCTPAEVPVRVSMTLEGGTWLFKIRDGGRGLSVEDLNELFRTYLHAPEGNEQGGVGLGLCVSRQIMEIHGGTIGVESQPGQGSTFWFKLPCSPPVTSGT